MNETLIQVITAFKILVANLSSWLAETGIDATEAQLRSIVLIIDFILFFITLKMKSKLLIKIALAALFIWIAAGMVFP